MKYFSYNDQGGFTSHKTKEEARAVAEGYLEGCKDCAADGWPEDTDSTCWGEIKGMVVTTVSKPWDEMCDEKEEMSQDKGLFSTYEEHALIDVVPQIHYEDGGAVPKGWYFWDETEANRLGPYKTESSAYQNFQAYCRAVL